MSPTQVKSSMRGKPGNPSSRQGPRVNLTLTPELDNLLARITAITGRGKASIVTQILQGALPQLQEMARALELAAEGNLDAFSVMSKAMKSALHQGEQTQLELTTARRAARRRKSA